MNEPSEKSSGAKEPTEQSVEERLMDIAEKMGSKKTLKLVQAREKIKLDQLHPGSRKAIIAYQRLEEELVATKTDPSHPKPPLGLSIAIASLKYANGFVDAYRDDMTNAMFYATRIGEHETVLELRKIFFEYLNPKNRLNP